MKYNGDNERNDSDNEREMKMKTKTVKARMFYVEPVTPPRCRKARARVAVAEHDVAVPVYGADEAPVAITIKQYPGLEMKNEKMLPLSYRLIKGKLYLPRELHYGNNYYDSLEIDGSQPQIRALFNNNRLLSGYRCSNINGSFSGSSFDDFWSYRPPVADKQLAGFEHNWFRDSEAESAVKDRFERKWKEIVLIDGAFWQEAEEPFYDVKYDGTIEIWQHFWNGSSPCTPIYNLSEDVPGNKRPAAVEVLIPEAIARPTFAELREIGRTARALKTVATVGTILDANSGEIGPTPAKVEFAEFRAHGTAMERTLEARLDRLMEDAFFRLRPGAEEPSRAEHDERMAELKKDVLGHTSVRRY